MVSPSGMMGPWVLGSLGPWVLGSLGPWVLGSLGPWVLGSLGPWVPGSLGPWVPGSLGPSVHQAHNQRTLGARDRGTPGPPHHQPHRRRIEAGLDQQRCQRMIGGGNAIDLRNHQAGASVFAARHGGESLSQGAPDRRALR